MITYNKTTFLANNNYCKVCTLKRYRIFYPKRKKRNIIILDFLFLQSQLNILSFSLEKQQKLASASIFFKAITYIQYSKIEERYWIDKHLLNQIKNKALSITKALYPGYELLFIFDNATGYAIYTKNILQIVQIKKDLESQQLFLQAKQYWNTSKKIISQRIYILVKNFTNVQSQKI